MKVNILVNGVPWFGKYSGYECLGNYFPQGTKVTTTYSPDSKLIRALGKGVNMWYNGKLGNIRNDGIWAAYKFLRKGTSHDVSHILYADGNLKLFETFNKKNNLFGTIHFPVSFWKKERLKQLEYLNNGIILYKEELEQFGEYTNPNRMKFIRHGVDTNFFKPGPTQDVNKKKVLFVGSFLRNFDMFLQVYNMIESNLSREFEYHFIVPGHQRGHAALQKLSAFSNVFFHEKLTDEEMLWYYQTSYVLLMPMDDSGANTAIIQAISTGLPVITTDVGGIRSYGGGDIYPLIANNDSVGMVELFSKFQSDEDYRNKIAKQQRDFALNEMDWYKIAGEHLQHYQQVISANR
ncbi:glycosyltransferase family 4 protein [Mucilaginibacter lacusdianchii]|uniref:glycosyltransferase family 4 protein n=1 Tax=Mucilaginibacter lacusdianchii TaxID=2684211 RepID=UPI00131AE1B2|nr:glycosyltransferase family 4 protein [Mucilaginibacter sp. JXJ CY 39]